MSEFGAAWDTSGQLSLTAPPGEGWTAQLALSARKRNGTRTEWSEDVLLSAETATHTIAAPVGDDGMVTLLVAWVTYVNEDGRQLRTRGLGGHFVAAVDGMYAETEERFTSYISATLFEDPHEGLETEEEVAR